MKTFKHLKSLFTALLLLCTTVATAHDFKVGGIFYNIENSTTKEVAVTYYSGGNSKYTGNVTIPQSVTYNGTTYSVTTIGAYAFQDCTGLTSVEIPNSVTSIGYGAFYNCTGLTSIEIPNGVTYIGDYAFRGCTGLTSIEIPNGVTSFGKCVFYGCTGLKNVEFVNGVTYIGDYAFYECTGLTSVEIPNSVTSIRVGAFYGCTGLTSIEIPNSVTSIGNSAFYGCTGLTSIEIPNSVISIGNSAFYGCTGLTSVVIDNSVTSIGNSAFENCTDLAKVVNLSNLTFTKGSSDYGYVAYYADNIYNAPNGSLEGDFIFAKPNGVNTLLYYLGNEKELTLPADYKGEDYVIGANAFEGNTTITSITIPGSVTGIGNYAFRGCTGLTSVVIDNSVTSIGNCAFDKCSGLTSIEIPNSVTSIGNFAFAHCSGLTSVVIPNSVTSIGGYAFYGCTGLTNVVIGNSVTSIGEAAFGLCQRLRSVEFNAENCTNMGDYVFGDCTEFSTVTIGEKVKNIPACAFIKCSGLTSVVIPNSVTSIGESAFENCCRLQCVVIGNGVTNIGNDAFYNCTDLAKVVNLSNLTFTKGSSRYGYIAYYADKIYTPLNSSIEIEGDFIFAKPNGVNTLLYYLGNEKELTLPADYKGEDYVIGANAFEGNTTITSITIPSCVTSIGDYAFYNCTGLTSVEIGNGVTSIGDYAFYKCIDLTSVIIGNSVTSIGDYAFYECTGLKSVVIGNSVTSIGAYAFYNCYSLTSIEIPNSVTSIGEWAFYRCTGLTSVEIPNSVTSIGNDAFKDCYGLKSVVIGNSVTSIGNDAFEYCEGLKEVHISDIAAWCGISFSDSDANPLYYAKILYLNGEKVTNLVIPEGVKEIKKYAFEKCTGLTSIEIPNSVTSIGDSAFDGCTGLTSVEIPNSVTSIGQYAFYACSGLTSVEIPNSVTSIGQYAFYGCTGLTSVEIPNSVTSIGKYAFYACSGLTSVEIPNGVTSIGDYAFQDCTGLTSVVIPNSVTSIGNYAFKNCYGLTSIEIPNSVTSIKYDAFRDCTGLTSVVIGNSVTSIWNDAFKNCTGLKTVVNYSDLTFTKGSSDYGYIAYYADNIYNAPNGSLEGDFIFAKPNGVNTLLYYLGNEKELTLPADYKGEDYVIGANAFKGNTTITSITIPSSVTSIGNYAFYECTGLKSVVIGNSVTSIGNYAFEDCTGLTSIEIPNSVTSIGNGAFNGCTGLTSVIIGNSVTSIGISAFFNCSGLTSVVIPNSVTSIGNYAFRYCTGLKNVEIGNSVTSIGNSAFSGCTRLTSITIPNSVTFIGEYAFSGCTGLASIVILNSVTSIGDYAFAHCSGLKNVEIGNGVTSIGNSAFEDCERLTSVIIGNSVTSIGNYAFDNCYGLKSVVIGNSVTSIGNNAFDDCTGLKEVHISDIAAWCGIDFYESIANPLYYAKILYLNGEKVTNLVIPEGVKEIKKYAFEKCTGLTSIEIPNSVTSIGDSAFEGTAWYDNQPNGIVYAGKVLYKYKGTMPSYTSITIKDGTLGIAARAFEGYSGLTSITIPNSVTSIGDSAFNGCTGLNTVYNLSNLTFTKGSSDYGYIAYYAGNIYNAPNSSLEGDFIFAKPNGVNTLLYYLGNEKELTLPADYKGEDYVIGANAFEGNTTITSITIPGCVTSIGNSAFEGCKGLRNIRIPSSVTSVGDYAFKNCENLKNAIIGYRATELALGKKLFEDSPIDSLYIGGKITYLSEPSQETSPFCESKSLRTVVITDIESKIYDFEFYNCSGLEKVTVGDGVESIGRWAFSGCYNLDEFIFGSNVSSIGEEAFSDCSKMTKITSRALLPPTCGEQALDDIDKWSCTLYAPERQYTAYQEADQWKEFLFKEKYVTTDRYATFILDGKEYKTLLLTPGKRIIVPDVADREGVEFSGWNLEEFMTVPNPSPAAVGARKAATRSSEPIVTKTEIDLAGNADAMLYTNAPCTNTQWGDEFKGWYVLFDDNPNTIFHSEYGNKQTTDGHDHYIRVDMGEGDDLGVFEFTYTNRSDNGTNAMGVAPKTIIVEGCNSENGTYTTIATLTNLSSEGSYVYTSGELGSDDIRYRYIRFRVTETFGNNLDNGHPFFAISEFGMSRIEYERTPELEQEIDLAGNADAMLYTNAPCTNTQWGDEFKGWYVLFDDNPNTFFHSEYSDKQSADGLDHYIRVDMGEGDDLGVFEFTYTNRRDNGNDVMGVAPKTIVVEGSNSANGTYTAIATITNLSREGSYVYTSGELGSDDIRYRYIRFRVTETFGNSKNNGHPFFAISEFGMSRIEYERTPEPEPEPEPKPELGIEPEFGLNEIVPIMPDRDIVIYGSFGLPGDINKDGEVNVGDFAALVNIIFNSESIDDTIKFISDINGDGEVNVGDFAALVNLIFNSGSQASPQRAATRAAADETTFYIEPFSIAAGETKEIPVLMENPGEKFSQLQFDITLPEGLEIPEYFDEELFDDVKAIKHGSRTSQKAYSIQTQPVGEALRVLCITQNSKAFFTGESGDVLLITVKAADEMAIGDVEIKITNTVLSRQDGTTYKPADCTATVSVADATGINVVGADGDNFVVYTLGGVKVLETTDINKVTTLPTGFYLVNGKQVFIK